MADWLMAGRGQQGLGRIVGSKADGDDEAWWKIVADEALDVWLPALLTGRSMTRQMID